MILRQRASRMVVLRMGLVLLPFPMAKTTARLSHKRSHRCDLASRRRRRWRIARVSARPSSRMMFSSLPKRPRTRRLHELWAPMCPARICEKVVVPFNRLAVGLRTSGGEDKAKERAAIASSTAKRHRSPCEPASSTVASSHSRSTTPKPPASTLEAPLASLAETIAP